MADSPQAEMPPADRDSGREPSSPGSWWRASLTLATGILLALATLATIWVIAWPLALFFAAIVLSQAIEPAVSRLDRRLPRLVAVVIAYGGLTLILAGFLWFVVSGLEDQVQSAAGVLPGRLDQIERQVIAWNPTLGRGLRQTLETWVGDAADVLIRIPFEAVSSVTEVVLVVVLAAYWSAGRPAIRRFAVQFIRPSVRDEVADTTAEVVATIGGYVRARVIAGAVVGIATFLGLQVIGVPLPLVLALLAAVGELVPIVGPVAAVLPAILLTLIDGPEHALYVVLLALAIQQVKSHLLIPFLAQEQADIPPLLVIFAVLAGTAVGGILGAFVTPPFLGALRILVLRVGVPFVRQRQPWGD